MKRALALGAVTGLMAFGIAPAASAGEITGNQKPTPIALWKAASICAFSGLDDQSEMTTPNWDARPRLVQNWGHEDRPKAAGKLGMTPGVFCNPNTVFPE